MNTFIRLLLLLISFFLVFSKLVRGQNDLEFKIDSIFHEFSLETPGIMVSIVKKDSIIYSKGYGSAQLEYGIPINEKTVFHIASDSKRFTAMAILLLEKQGLISLSDDIHQFFPKLHDFGRKITIKNLLHHTSGLRDQWQLLGMAGIYLEDVITQDHILSLLFEQRELNFIPGEEFTYCNTGYTLLAEIVSKVSGLSFEEFTHRNIFQPLEMHNTHFHSDHKQIVPNRAYSYSKIGDDNYEKEILNFSNVGATSLFTTAEDLQKWLSDVMSDQPKVADKKLTTRMQKKAALSNGEPLIYGMGEMNFTFKGMRLVGHGGNDAGFNSFIGYFPNQELGVIALSNLKNISAGNLVLQVADVFFENGYKRHETSVRQKQAKAERTPQSFITPSIDTLTMQTGIYETIWGNVIVKEEDGELYFKNVDEESDFQLFKAETMTQYFNESDQLVIKFSRFKNGHYYKLKVTGPNNTNFSAERIFLVDYSVRELAEFVGVYVSKELDTRYEIILKDSTLIAKHTRLQDIELSLKSRDRFTGNKWFFDILQFDRNQAGDIVAVLISGGRGRAKNIRFDKIN
ncbi:MAG: serine hydrolase domain-containing protein [Bacteroidota bacterium]